MTTRTRSRRTRRAYRPRRTRLLFIDRLMLAAIAGGVAYLTALYLPHVPVPAPIAIVLGLVVFGFALGVLTAPRRSPYLRSPVGWRRWR